MILKDVGTSPSKQAMLLQQTQARHPLIQFTSDTVYLEKHQIPLVRLHPKSLAELKEHIDWFVIRIFYKGYRYRCIGQGMGKGHRVSMPSLCTQSSRPSIAHVPEALQTLYHPVLWRHCTGKVEVWAIT
jgi:hypothetical protein